jgi:glyoxylase-like metal-dependent hydrolase (beta-lactamase superfamily II)
MIVKTLVVGLVQTNCYVIADEDTGKVAVIDPGGDVERILSTVEEVGKRCRSEPQVVYVVNTHGHFDHSLENAELLERLARFQHTAPKLVAHTQATTLLAAGGGAAWFGVRSSPGPEPDWMLSDGETLALGGQMFQVLHTPGHSLGSISLYNATEKCVFVGDVLFSQSVGRADLPGGDWKTLLNSIRSRLLSLPEETTVYPGHGPATTIDRERTSNPFL